MFAVFANISAAQPQTPQFGLGAGTGAGALGGSALGMGTARPGQTPMPALNLGTGTGGTAATPLLSMPQTGALSMPQSGMLGMPQTGLGMPQTGALSMPQTGLGMPQSGMLGMPQTGAQQGMAATPQKPRRDTEFEKLPAGDQQRLQNILHLIQQHKMKMSQIKTVEGDIPTLTKKLEEINEVLLLFFHC